MKHGIRSWQKKLNRTPSHRASLARNMTSQLFLNERIQTTVAKAKFIKHYADQCIDWAKQGEETKLREFLFDPDQTVSKVMGSIAFRFQSQDGDYCRILRSGHRSKGSDVAPLAVLELPGHYNDIVYKLSLEHKEKIQEQISELELKRYNRTVVSIRDPVTGEPTEFAKLTPREDLTASEIRHLERKLTYFRSILNNFLHSERQWQAGRVAEEESAKALSEKLEEDAVRQQQQKLQADLDEAAAYQEAALGRKLASALRRSQEAGTSSE
ncbi:ribosomal protein L17 [Polychytrium aggregatum]|uniref:ribosomal protein L17 n=1 Tax=Polychytrium aggregatum TaxID=110093 RepID=UPI0022FE0A00|nr:ribosomal protein L17 [Polychytrium aggregatum]KAI9204853.1 ribosomal protein L17 [Polychytrium aggregatum]